MLHNLLLVRLFILKNKRAIEKKMNELEGLSYTHVM
jgi:hypothetical protein